MEYLLQLTLKDVQPIKIDLEGDNIVIGKSIFPFLAKYAKVSDRHASLRKKGNVWYVKDLGSVNGVYVNYNKICSETPLENDDTIGFGDTELSCGGFICSMKGGSKISAREKRPACDNDKSRYKNVDTIVKNSAFGISQQWTSSRVKSCSSQKEVHSSDSSSSPTFSKVSRLSKSKSSQNSRKRCRRPRISSSDSSDVGYQTEDRFNHKSNSQGKNMPQKLKNSTSRKKIFIHTSSSSECSARIAVANVPRKESPETLEKINSYIQNSFPNNQKEVKKLSHTMNKENMSLVIHSDDSSASDSSVSCHSRVMYPSKSVTEKVNDHTISSENSSATESALSDVPDSCEKSMPLNDNMSESLSNKIETLGKKQLISKNEKGCKSVGKTLLTDPKPIQQYFKQRDKQSWLAKRNLSFNCSEKKKKKLTDSVSEKCKGKNIHAKDNSSGRSSNIEGTSLKDAEKSLPNFGVIKSDLQNPSKDEKIKEDRTPKRTVPRRHDNYGSRMAFLVSAEENHPKKSKKSTNEKILSSSNRKCPDTDRNISKHSLILDKKNDFSPSSHIPNAQSKNAGKSNSDNALENMKPIYKTNVSTLKEEYKSKFHMTKQIEPLSSHSTDSHKLSIKPGIPANDVHASKPIQVNCKSPPIKPRILANSISTSSPKQKNSRSPPIEPGISTSNIPISKTVKVNCKSPMKTGIPANNLPTFSSVPVISKSPPSNNVFDREDKQKRNSSINKSSNATPCIISRKNSSEMPIKYLQTPYTQSMREDLISKIVRWKTEWLNTELQMIDLLPLLSKEVVPLSLSYQSVDSYISALHSMILLEIFDMVHESSTDICKEETRNNFLYSAIFCENKYDLIEICCETIVGDNACYPVTGDVIKMEISTLSRQINVLGYVNKHELRTKENYSSMNVEVGNKRICTFYVYVQNIQSFLPKNNLKASRICSIKRKLRLAEAIECLRVSPLKQDIIGPTSETFSVELPKREYNITYNEVIQSINAEILRPNTDRKIILLHGFPGTGKTRAVVNIIEDLFFSCVSGKILVAASSDTAINEIGSRLIEANERSSWRTVFIKFVKIGPIKQNHHKKGKSASNSPKESQDVPYFASRRYDNMNLDREEDICPMSQYDKYNKRWVFISEKSKAVILRETNVVLVTIDSYEYFISNPAFKTDTYELFEYCIVDEASRFTEPDILQMLGPGINRLVLVGDHVESHATVHSKLACHFGFERSMFERFYAIKDSLNEPVITFTEQCRMHPQICYFPSKYYYESKLRTCADLDKRYQFFPSQPYFFCNILNSKESDDMVMNLKFNHMEAAVVSCLCITIRKLDPEISVGIITATVGQISCIKGILYQHSEFKDVEISTVENFQGREKDLIIVSCVRTEGSSGDENLLTCRSKLIVALTRARQSLIICGSVNYLKQLPDWNVLIRDACERKLLISVPYFNYVPQIFLNKMKKAELFNTLQ